MSLLNTRLLGTADRIDVFMHALTLPQLRATVVMGLVRNHPQLRRDEEFALDGMLPVIEDTVDGYAFNRRLGVSPLVFGVTNADMLEDLTEGALRMRPHFLKRDTLSSRDISLLFGLQATQRLAVLA